MTKSNRRRNFLINPNFQIRFIVYVITLVLCAIGIFYFMDLYFFSTMLKRGIEMKLVPNHVYFSLIREQKEFMDQVFLFTGLVVFFIIVVFGVLLSHRIAGPMYRLHLYLDQITESGKIRPLSFRDKDYFPEIPKAFNSFLRRRTLLDGDR